MQTEHEDACALEAMAKKLEIELRDKRSSPLDIDIITAALRMSAEILRRDNRGIRKQACLFLDALEAENVKRGKYSYIPMQLRQCIRLRPYEEVHF